MPDQPGVCVFMSGHVGVYIGDGYVIEARGHAYGVVKTKLAGRGWVSWGKPDWLVYDTKAETTKTAEAKKVEVKLPVLSAGTSGEAVKALQILLNGRGYGCGSADGIFGDKTTAAVKKYQTAHGLYADGVCGALTWSALIG